MVKVLGSIYLNKKFSTSNLNSKVGQVHLMAGKNNDIKTGAYRGVGLKKVMVGIGQGMTKGLLEKELKKYIGSSQINKRKAIMNLAFGNEDESPAEGEFIKASDGKSYLSKEQVESNLLRNKDRDQSEFNSRTTHSETYGGGVVKSYGVHGAMASIGVKRGKVGFAADNRGRHQSPDSPVLKAPPGGIKPIGL